MDVVDMENDQSGKQKEKNVLKEFEINWSEISLTELQVEEARAFINWTI